MGIPAARRQARSARITAAVGLLAVASIALGASLATGEQFLVGAAGVFALAMGWTALRLAWTGLVQDRYSHAVDRTELAQAYRELFAARAVEHAGFVASLAERLAHRDRMIEELEGAMAGVEMRAVEAEASALTYRHRLGDAIDQIGAMESLISRNLREQGLRQQAAAAQAQSGEQQEQGAAAAPTPLRHAVVPEWADLETDPVTALMAWEEHAADVAQTTGRHADWGEDSRAENA
ncbi:hypothetical protein D9V37_00165 [Nocardioides mangrovicus]|uniref:Uncharacterized protein n=1 Tax=Nocardioides mangrovicus TaxID=2478913 RepID=A0A3L8P745_9ACTN|nr:hypothetical protein [Nocardioides mangrovicus]RLV50449.1 hypothetical protein D9V37_00165 [Nocardioides mangrovicus]